MATDADEYNDFKERIKNSKMCKYDPYYLKWNAHSCHTCSKARFNHINGTLQNTDPCNKMLTINDTLGINDFNKHYPKQIIDLHNRQFEKIWRDGCSEWQGREEIKQGLIWHKGR